MSPERRLVPAPPAPFPHPVVERWPAGEPLCRVFALEAGPLAFSAPGVRRRGRFSWGTMSPTGVVYLAESEGAAVAESLLHGTTVPGGIPVPERYVGAASAWLAPAEDVHLAQLHSGGLRRLRLRAANITDTTAAHYERTAAWAGAIHAATDLHGLVWMSRQWNSKRCVALFEDRAPALRVVDKGARLFGSAPDDAEWLAGPVPLAGRPDDAGPVSLPPEWCCLSWQQPLPWGWWPMAR